VVFQSGRATAPIAQVAVASPAPVATLPTAPVVPAVNLKAREEFRKLFAARSGTR
jgi:hypothetical protein